MVIIHTKCFQLKSLTINNVNEKYLSWFNSNAESKKFISFAQDKKNLDELVQYVKGKENKKDTLFLGIFCSSGIHIGNIKYEPINFDKKTAVMGILIGEVHWRGKGVAYEVINAVNEYLKTNFDIKFIYLGVDKTNDSAISFYKKMNFKIIENNRISFKMRLDL